MASPLPVLPAVRLLSILAPIVGGAAVLAWRLQETRTPVTARKLLLPPLGMSTGFLMFASPSMRIPLSWALGAFLVGALVLSWPLARTSTLERDGDAIMMRRSNRFFTILGALLLLRVALHDYVGTLVSARQTASLFFVLAFGMIVRWRVTLFARFRALERNSTEPNA